MSNNHGKDLYSFLNDSNQLEYGSVISGDVVRACLKIVVPELGTKKEFDELALRELSAMDYVRNILLGQGKYITQANGSYRILLPSENAHQIELYMKSADKKLSRALKLSRNSPKTDSAPNSQIEARILMKQHSARRRF